MSCRPLTAVLPFSNFLSTLAMFSRPILVLAGEAVAPAGGVAPPFWARSEPAPRYNPPPKATTADRHAIVFFTESPPLPEPPGRGVPTRNPAECPAVRNVSAAALLRESSGL